MTINTSIAICEKHAAGASVGSEAFVTLFDYVVFNLTKFGGTFGRLRIGPALRIWTKIASRSLTHAQCRQVVD